MALPSVDYAPRDPSADVLHRVVREHLQTFLAEAAYLRDSEGVPRFVEAEFQAFLACGFFAGGFARCQCVGCQAERLVAFSCKGRGFCPSCGGRRMTERAAHLVDHVLPDVPFRQWVLTLPHRLRYLLAWRHDLCKAVVRVLLREVHRHLRTRARERGLSDVRGGAVAVVQRFGGALNLNVHIHALVLDGVFARGDDGRLRFHAAPELDAADVADVLAAIAPGVHRLLRHHGADPDDASASDAFAEASPLLAGLAAASVQGRVALGGTPGAHPRLVGQLFVDCGEPAMGACHARWEGFDLHAAVRVPLAWPRFNTLLLGVFAASALLLSAVGLYGVMAASVRQRFAEIGVRLALGATGGDVRRLVLGEGLRLAAGGALAGLALAWASTRVLEGLLFETEPLDPWVLTAATALLVVAAVLATWLPARRAMRVDPIEVLRAE